MEQHHAAFCFSEEELFTLAHGSNLNPSLCKGAIVVTLLVPRDFFLVLAIEISFGIGLT